jgi:N,N'-diacetyllegionaminate synthase
MIKKPIFIAEAGVNHNGSLKIAKKLIDLATMAKADFVKFQSYVTEKIVHPKCPSANYQKKVSLSQYKLLKKYELSFDQQKKIYLYCKNKKIKFLSSPFDQESARFLVEELKLKYIKIPSGEITNFFLLKYLSTKNIKIFLSTGAANLKEITDAIKILLSGKILKKNLCVMHCTTAYPANFENLNLKYIQTLKEKLDLNIGYSDHSQGIFVPILANFLGANVIEKHFTLDKKLKGPDHKASLDQNELLSLTYYFNNFKKIIGKKNKSLSKEEIKNRNLIRKSIYASKNLYENDILFEHDIQLLRPCAGKSPIILKKKLNKKLNKNVKKNSVIF